LCDKRVYELLAETVEILNDVTEYGYYYNDWQTYNQLRRLEKLRARLDQVRKEIAQDEILPEKENSEGGEAGGRSDD